MLLFMVLVLVVDTALIAASVMFGIVPSVVLVVWLLLASLASLAIISLGRDFDD